MTLDDGGEITAERLLVAVGRTSNIDDLGLETVGLDPSARVLATDARGRAADKLWGVGDVNGPDSSPTLPRSRRRSSGPTSSASHHTTSTRRRFPA